MVPDNLQARIFHIAVQGVLRSECGVLHVVLYFSKTSLLRFVDTSY